MQLPHVRELGRGPTAACFHSNASHAGQWRALMEDLATDFRVLAFDSYGSGKSADWRSDREISLDDEADFVEPALRAEPAPLHLVGHSYGAAVALKLALRDPARIASLVLYEPTLFWLVDRASPPPNGVDGIRDAGNVAAAFLDRGDEPGAARAFIDFWMGAGSFDAMPPPRRQAVAASVKNVRRWKHACFTDTLVLGDLARLEMPVLLLGGSESPRSASSVLDLVAPAFPNARRVVLRGLGHMAPVTDAGPVNAEIAGFLREVKGR